MTLIKNISPLGDLAVPALGVIVEAGKTIDVSDEILDSFISQSENWEAVAYAPKTKTPTPADSVTPSAPSETQGE